MDILKRRSLPEDKVYVGICRNCGTHFRFKRKEGTVVHDQRHGDFITAACPVCEKPCHQQLKPKFE